MRTRRGNGSATSLVGISVGHSDEDGWCFGHYCANGKKILNGFVGKWFTYGLNLYDFQDWFHKHSVYFGDMGASRSSDVSVKTLPLFIMKFLFWFT